MGLAQSPVPSPTAAAQQTGTTQVWQMQKSGTTAGLRGIDSVDGTVAWASGTEGTVLKTVDGGAHWTKCAVPDGDKDGATLDFRGVQAWDATTAIVMASGPGDKSRLYKTTDGCRTWMLLFKNSDTPDGFFDSLSITKTRTGGRGFLLGDPVAGRLTIYWTGDRGVHWEQQKSDGLEADAAKLGAFAASNSSILPDVDNMETGMKGPDFFAVGGKGGSFVFVRVDALCTMGIVHDFPEKCDIPAFSEFHRVPVPVKSGTESTGIFALGEDRDNNVQPAPGVKQRHPGPNHPLIAVGGDYAAPNESIGTAAWSVDGGWTWAASATPPRGYRSTVQWSASEKLWITAGTNGSDISRDDGRTWQPLDDGNWNALSLPFIVGPKGRIARLNASALPPAK